MADRVTLNRREFLQRGALSASLIAAGFAQPGSKHARSEDSFLGLLKFQQEGGAPVDAVIGSELDQRFYTDLASVPAHQHSTPTNAFFVRSGASLLLPRADEWTIHIDGLVERPATLGIRDLRRAARPMGTHLIECAGNVRIVHFGLIGVASWTGVPIGDVLAHAGVQGGAAWVRVSGFDQYATASQTSIPGADWIFPLNELKDADAFLATGMNGMPLAPDHGAPVRLVVPGWYGCACIKWVQSVTMVDDRVEATTQMREYAVRTLQDGRPELARDFAAATVDHAALPVRVEKWRIAGRLRYKVVGILWGGQERVETLQIRFNPDEAYVPIKGFLQSKDAPWTVWSHVWTPVQTGLHAIQLSVAEPQVRARKMHAGYYVRFVDIAEIG